MRKNKVMVPIQMRWLTHYALKEGGLFAQGDLPDVHSQWIRHRETGWTSLDQLPKQRHAAAAEHCKWTNGFAEHAAISFWLPFQSKTFLKLDIKHKNLLDRSSSNATPGHTGQHRILCARQVVVCGFQAPAFQKPHLSFPGAHDLARRSLLKHRNKDHVHPQSCAFN